MTLELRPTRETCALAASAGLGIGAVFLTWSTVQSDCGATEVSRGFRDLTLPTVWAWLYVLAFLGMLSSSVVHGVPGTVVVGAATVLALVTTAAIMTDLLVPFEAFRPRPGLPPLPVLCQLEPGAGVWAATAGWCLGGLATAWRLHLRFPAGTRRVLGASAAVIVATAYAWPWVYVLVDAATDAASPRGTWLVVAVLILVGAIVGYITWRGGGGHRMLVRALLSVGASMLFGPLLLGVLRAVRLGRPRAAILASWSGNDLIGPIVVVTIGAVGAVLMLAGSIVHRRQHRGASSGRG